MAKFKTHKSFTRLVKRILKNMVAIFEDMETPDQNMWSPIEAAVPMYTRTTDSGYNSNTHHIEPKTDAPMNNKMIQTRLKRKDNRLHSRLDYELASFWMSAESPYWPCKKKTLQKVDVDCLLHTTEEFVKNVIKTIYHLYQDSCVNVNGTLDHIERNMELALIALSNQSLPSNDDDKSILDADSNWTIRISSHCSETTTDVDSEISFQSSEMSEDSRLKFTAKQNSHLLHGNPRKASDILLSKRHLKKRCQKNTILTASNDNLNLTFHFTE